MLDGRCASPKLERSQVVDFSTTSKEESSDMLVFLLGLFRLVWLIGKGHRGVVMENLALRQQLSIYKRNQKRPRLVGRDRFFWLALSTVWKDWRRALFVVHPDTVVRWQREQCRRFCSCESTRLQQSSIHFNMHVVRGSTAITSNQQNSTNFNNNLPCAEPLA